MKIHLKTLGKTKTNKLALRNKKGQFVTAVKWFLENQGTYSFKFLPNDYQEITKQKLKQIQKQNKNILNKIECAILGAYTINFTKMHGNIEYCYIDKNGSVNVFSDKQQNVNELIKTFKQNFYYVQKENMKRYKKAFTIFVR